MGLESCQGSTVMRERTGNRRTRQHSVNLAETLRSGEGVLASNAETSAEQYPNEINSVLNLYWTLVRY